MRSPDPDTTILMRASLAALWQIAEDMHCTVDIGVPDEDGIHEPTFTRKPIEILRRTGPISQEDVDDLYGGVVPEGRWLI